MTVIKTVFKIVEREIASTKKFPRYLPLYAANIESRRSRPTLPPHAQSSWRYGTMYISVPKAATDKSIRSIYTIFFDFSLFIIFSLKIIF